MNDRLPNLIEAHPMLAWLASLGSFAISAFEWSVKHSDDAAKVFGLCATIFAVIAGYYTMRIQRRAWKRGERLSRESNPPIS